MMKAWITHPLAPTMHLVAARERRFQFPSEANRAYLAIQQFYDEATSNSRYQIPSNGLSRRTKDLSLAYRLGLVASPAIAALGVARRLPDLSAENVLVLAGLDRELDRFTLRTLAFSCLADDPEAGHDDATVVGSVDELRDQFHRVYSRGWLAGMISAIANESPVNVKALWGMVASGWASAADHVAQSLGDTQAAVGELEQLLDGEPRALLAPVRFYVQNADGVVTLRHWRGVCCLNYRMDGKELCEGECPLLPSARVARLVELTRRGAPDFT